MKNSGLKNEELLRNLQVSGSAAILSRNRFGVHLFTEENLKDGVVGARLGRSAYNLDELQRSVDTTISELIPVEAEELPDTVLREVYQEVVDELAESVVQIQSLEEQVQNVESTLLLSASRVQELEQLNDELELQKSLLDNRLQVANDQIASITTELQYAIQKSTQEAINRVSLERRNENILNENERLRDLVRGRDRELSQGAELLGGLTILNLDRSRTDIVEDVYGAKRPDGNWAILRGEYWRLTNTSDNPLTLRVYYDHDGTNSTMVNEGWFRIDGVYVTLRRNPRTYTIESNESVDMRLTFDNRNAVDALSGLGSSTYDGFLVFEVVGTNQRYRANTRLRRR